MPEFEKEHGRWFLRNPVPGKKYVVGINSYTGERTYAVFFGADDGKFVFCSREPDGRIARQTSSVDTHMIGATGEDEPFPPLITTDSWGYLWGDEAEYVESILEKAE